MIKLKRKLIPISLAIPSLLALSATAGWTPLVTESGTGFDGYADSGGLVYGGYSRPGFQLNCHFTGGYYPWGGGAWQSLYDVWKTTDSWYMGVQFNAPVAIGVADCRQGSSNLGYGSVQWYN